MIEVRCIFIFAIHSHISVVVLATLVYLGLNLFVLGFLCFLCVHILKK